MLTDKGMFDIVILTDNRYVNPTTTNWYINDNGNYLSHIRGNSNKLQRKSIHSIGNENEFVFFSSQ